MASSNVNAMVKEAIRVLKAGNKAEARKLLERATELDSYNEQGWLWLSGVVDSDEDQRTCLNNVLFINPNNSHAKQGLGMLDAKIAAKTPDRSFVLPDESPFAELDLPKGDNLLDELEIMRTESSSQPSGSISPFTANDFDDIPDDFGSFDAGFDDPFADAQAGPFSSSPFTVNSPNEEPAVKVPPKRSELESAAESMFSDSSVSKPSAKRRTSEVQVQRPASPTTPAPTGVAALFRMIPKEIMATRVPGANTPTPFMYRILVLGLVVVDVYMAFLTFSKILAPISGGQG